MVTVAEQRNTSTPQVEQDRRVDQMRKRYRAKGARNTQRQAEGKPRKIEDAETVDEALDIEFERGKAEGAAEAAKRNVSKVAAPTTKAAAPVARPLRERVPSVPIPSNPQTSPGSIGAPFLVNLVFISADEIALKHRAPLPSRILPTMVVFGTLGLLRGDARKVGVVFAWSLVLATFYAGVGPGATAPPVKALQWIGDFMSGKIGAVGQAPSGNQAGLLNRPRTATTPRPSGPGSVNPGPY